MSDVSETTAKSTDPVCGMAVDPGRAAGMSRVGGKAFYFCSPGCNQKFDADPTKFTGAPDAPAGGSCCGGRPSPTR